MTKPPAATGSDAPLSETDRSTRARTSVGALVDSCWGRPGWAGRAWSAAKCVSAPTRRSVRSVTERVALAPEARSPIEQATGLPAGRAQPGALANAQLPGNWSETLTPVAAAGPLFTTTSVYVTNPPAATGSDGPLSETDRSASAAALGRVQSRTPITGRRPDGSQYVTPGVRISKWNWSVASAAACSVPPGWNASMSTSTPGLVDIDAENGVAPAGRSYVRSSERCSPAAARIVGF